MNNQDKANSAPKAEDNTAGFVFENAEEYDLYQLSPENTAIVANAFARNSSLLRVLRSGEWVDFGTKEMLERKNTYQVLAKPKSPLVIALEDIDSVDEGGSIPINCAYNIVEKLASSLNQGGEV